MKNNEKQKQKEGRKIALAIAGGVLALFAALILWTLPWVWYDTTPKPLGSQLEYIGKDDYGCWLGFCDSKPGSTYFYATTMNDQEVALYFKDATLSRSSKSDSFHDYGILEFTSTKENFDIKFYSSNKVTEKYGIPPTSKPYIISLPDFKYLAAKQAL